MRLLSLAATAALLAGCAAVAPPVAREAEPFYSPIDKAAVPAGGVALVLSGGSARGFAHVGVIKALEANGLRPDLIVGSSMGSVVGALYASGLTAAELEAAVGRMDGSLFSELAMPGLGLLQSPLGLVSAEGMHRFVDAEAKRHRIEDFPIRFGAVATDLVRGEPQIFNAGDVGRAVSASSAVPGIITPVQIHGRLYGDGQLTSPLPVSGARKLGASVVIAVDVIYPPEDARLTSTLRVLFQAFAISVHRIKQWEITEADAVIAPELGETSGQWRFGDRARLIDAGEKATLATIERLRPLFARTRAAPR